MPNVLDLQILATDVAWDDKGGGEGATSCSVRNCSIYRMDSFAG